MICEQQTVARQCTNGRKQAAQRIGIVEIGRLSAENVITLRQRRRAEPVASGAEVDQPHAGIRLVRQLRRQAAADVGHRRERADDQ